MIRQAVAAAALLVSAASAHAEVVAQSDGGFVIRRAADVPAGAAESWIGLLQPAEWWSGEHTFSGDAQNLSLDPRTGGCFCEVLPPARDAESHRPRGAVEHMRVIYVENDRALRMSGALGPLQSEAVQGTLTIQLKPVGTGTRIMWEYVVGGYMRQPVAQIAPAVDRVLGEQLAGLARKLGGKDAAEKREPVRPSPEIGR
jgi:hypothetical protein